MTGGTFAILRRPGDGNGSPVVLLRIGHSESKPVGDATYVAPAVDGTSAWLTVGDRARRVDARTGEVVETVTLPPGTYPVSEVRSGLVLRLRGKPNDSEIWDPKVRAVVQKIVGGAYPGNDRYVVVRFASCDSECVRVLDTENGIPETVEVFDGATELPALSPDGKWLVGWVRDGNVLGLVAYEVGSYDFVALRGEIPAGMATSLAWSHDSRTLYTAVHKGTQGGILAWSPPNELLFSVSSTIADAMVVE
ncbi:MAG TPA: hypothetical protein VGX28_14275 [Frankiaceae bacterium]|jgi:hypothetical protein|nr:hypothetical protein [Frankiaceae bacterium]